MSAPLKLATFAAAVAAAFGLGLGAGAMAGPFDATEDPAEEVHGEHWHP